jgi:(5-formylfuran-3-yl)methyl phosphate synthase
MGSRLLVSVRSAAEALAALEGGADLIDVKEPTRGALGPADRNVVEQVVLAVGGRVPVSVALGEWADYSAGPLPAGVSFAKWGLSGLTDSLPRAVRAIRNHEGGAWPVLVAYADHERAGSPPVEVLARAACELRYPAFLIDTAVKDGTTLLDYLNLSALAQLRTRLAASEVPAAFAGSLNLEAIQRLLPVAPDWFAVRGAACLGGRDGSVAADQVRQLRTVISGLRTPVPAG